MANVDICEPHAPDAVERAPVTFAAAARARPIAGRRTGSAPRRARGGTHARVRTCAVTDGRRERVAPAGTRRPRSHERRAAAAARGHRA